MSSVNEIKIKLEGLQIGMYVSRTDRSWADLPTQLEGVVISSTEQIDMLFKYCKSVYIDISKGKSASPMYWIVEDNAARQENSIIDLGKNEYDLLRKESYQITEKLNDELVTAKQVYNKIKHQVHQAFASLEREQIINVDELKHAVSQTVDSIIRNPTAFKLVMEIKRTDSIGYHRALASSVWCGQFGRQLGLEKESINELALGGVLLDIGKIKVPDELLKKRGSLTREDILQLRSHVDFSVQMLINQDIPHNVMRMIATHHERADGTGYPQGLKNGEIPIYGRIAGIVDSFDAMINKRPFSSVIYSAHEAISDLYELRDRLFQADLVERFIQTIGLYPSGTLVELNSGEVAVVTAISELKRLKPTVMMILDENKNPYDEFRTVDLAKQNNMTIKRDLKYGDYGIKIDDLFL